MNKKVFNENVVIITGASTGIGRALALQLAKRGAWLSIAARTQDKLQMVEKECEQFGAKVLVVPTDVADPKQCENLIKQTAGEFGKIDTLINNAGITMWARFEEITDIGCFEKIMQVNYLGSVYCTHFALPHLIKSQGRIVAISSMTGKIGVPTRSGYAASKHAMVGFFDSLRIELLPKKVSVTLIYPDFVATETRKQALGANGKPIGKSHIQEDRVMTAETCADLIRDAILKRKRELYTHFRGKLSQWIKPISPKLLDHLSNRAIQRGC